MANEIIKGMGFHHVALKAADYESAYKFYTEGLGMKLYATWGEGDGRAAMLDLGDGGILELFARAFAAFVLVSMTGYLGVCMSGPVAWLAADVLLISATIYAMATLPRKVGGCCVKTV